MFRSRENYDLKQKIKELIEKNREIENKNQKLIIENEGLYDKYNELVDEFNEITKFFKIQISVNKDLITENSSLKNQITDIKEEIKLIKLENMKLKEELKKEKSNWIIEADSGWRINQVTGEREEYEIPYNFDIAMVRDLKFTRKGAFRKFKYYDKNIPGERMGSWKFYEIPNSLYNHQANNESNQNYLDPIQEQENPIKCIDDLKNLLDKKDLKLIGIYFENVYKFLFENIGRSFSTKEFINNCQFKNRESARQYLQKLIEYEIIRRFGRGNYKIIII